MALSGLPAFKQALKDMFEAMRAITPTTPEEVIVMEQQFCEDLATLIDTFVRTATVKVDPGIPLNATVVTNVGGLDMSVPSTPFIGHTGSGDFYGAGSGTTVEEGTGHLE